MHLYNQWQHLDCIFFIKHRVHSDALDCLQPHSIHGSGQSLDQSGPQLLQSQGQTVESHLLRDPVGDREPLEDRNRVLL